MAEFETITHPFGKVKRRHAPIESPTLLALPEDQQPPRVLGCTSCPAGSWYLDESGLACHCQIRRYVSWQPKQKTIIPCDDREQALKDEEDGASERDHDRSRSS